jgi:outer membrane protein, multidrug efflux system
MQEITGAIFAITLVMTAVFIRNEILARSGAYPPFVRIGADAAPDEHSLYTLDGAVEQHLNVVPGAPFPTPLPNYIGAFNVSRVLDIWRQPRNARDVAARRTWPPVRGGTTS